MHTACTRCDIDAAAAPYSRLALRWHLIGLDEASGNQLYEIPIPDTSSDSPDFFKFNGKYVLAVNWGALRAYEPATGAEAFRVGR